ncbi:EthD family reductase [Streptomyces sp. NPDC018019]|uniref:EthD family reductase n=1 Tax=Streptomyces sp. NPDC018019 TaxID=3365030 RepID=UPI0037AE22C6
MIHQLIFAYPKPGLTEEEFHRYWIDVHATRYASKIPHIQQYSVGTRIPLPGDSGDPQWCGVAEIWLPDEERQLASLQTPEFLDGARADEPRWAAFWRTLGLDTDPHIVLPGPPRTDRAPEAKLFLLTKRREGMPLADFREHSRSRHAGLALQVPGLIRYRQGFTRDPLYAVGEAPLDCVHQFSFADVPTLHAALRSAEFHRVQEDLGTFTNPRYVHTFAAQENWITGPYFV